MVSVCVKPDAYPGDVAELVTDALKAPGFFDPSNFTFGQPLSRSALEAAIQCVVGVRAVEELTIRRRRRPGWHPFTQPGDRGRPRPDHPAAERSRPALARHAAGRNDGRRVSHGHRPQQRLRLFGLEHPPDPLIPAVLPPCRNASGCPTANTVAPLLAAIREHEPLEHWRPNLRAGATPDLGVMLLEFWAYILDVTASTTPASQNAAIWPPPPMPKPWHASSGWSVTGRARPWPRGCCWRWKRMMPTRSRCRPAPPSAPNPSTTNLRKSSNCSILATVWPQRNRWRFAPIRETAFDGILTFPAGSAPNRGAIVVAWEKSGSASAAGQVEAVETITATGNEKLVRTHLDAAGETAFGGLAGLATANLGIAQLRITAGLSSFVADAYDTSGGEPTAVLDSVYPQVRKNDRVVVEMAGAMHPAKVSSVTTNNVELTPESGTIPATILPQTQIVLDTEIAETGDAAPLIHISMAPLPSPLRPTKAFLELPDLQPTAVLSGPVEPLDDAPVSGAAIAVGRRKRGADLPGTVAMQADGRGLFTPDSGADPFPEPLAAPAQLFGNVVEAIRGETVYNEVLGSSDGASPNQAYPLKKKPLAWTEDPSCPDGRRPYLEVAVDGIVWDRVDTLFDAAPDARIYLVRQQPDETSEIVFGDGFNGEIPASGGNNIVANWYRHGAGSAKPPAGFIQQLKKPVTGVSRVRSPLPATGGADADSADELRDNAPGFALALGRAISIDDFEALSRSYSGILNASASWAWDGRKQRAVATVWIIADQGDPGDELESWLNGMAAPGLGITVQLAVPHAFNTLAIDIAVDAAHDPEEVRNAAQAALFDTDDGVLTPANVVIGQPIYRSVIVKALHLVPGVASVRSVRLGGVPLDYAVHPGEGGWFDLEANASVGVVQ